MRISQIQALFVHEVSASLDHMATVTVTEDAREALSIVSAGELAVVIPAPNLEFITRTNWKATWDIIILAPTTDPVTTTIQIAPVIEELAQLAPGTARPDTFETTNGAVFPGYILTISDTYYDEGDTH